MTIKFFDKIHKEIKENGFKQIPANCVSGEEYEEWLRENKCEDAIIIEKPANDEYYKLAEESNKRFKRGNRAKCHPFKDGEFELSEMAKDWNNGHWDDTGDLNPRKFTPEEALEYKEVLSKIYKPTGRKRDI